MQLTGPVPINTFFDTGSFTTSAPFGILPPLNGNPATVVPPLDGQLFASANPQLPTSGNAWFAQGPHFSTIPAWLKPIYTDPTNSPPFGRMLFLTGSSPDGRADFSGLNALFTQIGAGGVSSQVGPTQWAALGTAGLDKRQCTEPTAPGAFGTLFQDPNWVQGLVATLKTSITGDSSLRANFGKGLVNASGKPQFDDGMIANGFFYLPNIPTGLFGGFTQNPGFYSLAEAELPNWGTVTPQNAQWNDLVPVRYRYETFSIGAAPEITMTRGIRVRATPSDHQRVR